MMKKHIFSGVLTLLFVGVALLPNAQTAQAATIDEMLAQIQVLMAKVQELQKQLATIRTDVKTILKDGLQEGMSDEDIKKIQEVLATDTTIYPEGKVTGYYGPLTKEALKRFQSRHGLEVTGSLNDETRDLLEEYLGERFNGTVPPGLLRAPGVMKKVEDRFWTKCTNNSGHGRGMGPLCKKMKSEHGNGMHDDHDEDEHEHEDEDEDDHDEDDDHGHHASSTTVSGVSKVEVEVEHGSTTVTFKLDGVNYTVDVDSTNQTTVLEAVADELDLTVAKLNTKLVKEIKSKLAKAVANNSDDSEHDAEDAINDAEDAVNDAEDAINDASGSTTEAQNLLDDAKDKLDDAEDAFDDEDYAEAIDLAKEAEDLAKDAEDAL